MRRLQTTRPTICAVACSDAGGNKTSVGVSEYDGQAELCFDSVEEMNAAFNEPRFLAEVHPDDATFIDMEGCKLMVVEEFQKVA
jgi:hypothetical protein